MTASRLLLVALLVVAAGCGGVSVDSGPSVSDRGTEWTVTVVRVVDGDTLEVAFADGHTEDVRLLGVDTPEVHRENDASEFEGVPDSAAGRAWLREWGRRAGEFARDRLLGREVRIRTDPMADRRGSFGRLLVYVVADGRSFNLELLERGYARLYDAPFGERERYAAAEERARAERVGLWGFDGPTTGTATADGGREDVLAVVEIHADAAGNDHENLNDEYVVFENTGESTLDLSGWTVRDAADHVFTVPDGTTLEPGARLTLYTGRGTDTDTELYWGSTSAVWNNGGDTVVVVDADGRVVARRTY